MKILIFSFIGAHTGQSQSTHPKESSKSLVLSGKALNGKKWHDIPSHSQILTQLKPTNLFLLTSAATIWDIWRTLYTLSANNNSSKCGVGFLGEPYKQNSSSYTFPANNGNSKYELPQCSKVSCWQQYQLQRATVGSNIRPCFHLSPCTPPFGLGALQHM